MKEAKETKSIKKAANGYVLIVKDGEQHYTDPKNVIINGKTLEVLLNEEREATILLAGKLSKTNDQVKLYREDNDKLKADLKELEGKFDELRAIYKNVIKGVLER